MVNEFLLIELLRSADPNSTITTLKQLEIANCKLANVVVLADDKLAAKLDCDSYADATKAILDKIAPVEGIVQTNLVSAVRPVHPK
jgi:hypothetical protein